MQAAAISPETCRCAGGPRLLAERSRAAGEALEVAAAGQVAHSVLPELIQVQARVQVKPLDDYGLSIFHSLQHQVQRA